MKYFSLAGDLIKMADLAKELDELLGNTNQEHLAIRDVMKRLERVYFIETLPMNSQAKLIAELANCQKFNPLNCLDAEQRVNGLLEYLSSQSHTVCALACSLMRVFCAFLDSNGQHITTQVTISCKNLLSIITKTDQQQEDYGLDVCKGVALASFCSIATDWSSKLQVPSQWLPFVLLGLNTVFAVLLDRNVHRAFLHQVASEGLRRILNIKYFWTSLTSVEKEKVLIHLKQLFDIHISAEKPDHFTLIKLLHSAANQEVSWTIVCSSKQVKHFLDVCWKSLPQINHTELDMNMPLDVRWAALKFLWTLLKALKKQQNDVSIVNLDKFKPFFINGCSNMDSTHRLKQNICCLLTNLGLNKWLELE